MAYSDKEREQLTDLMKDPRKVVVMCDEHFYVGNIETQPVKGCPNCWRAYYFKQLADTPPDRQEQFMDELEAVVKTLCYAEDRGVNPVELYQHPEVHIESMSEEEFAAMEKAVN